MVKVRHSSQYFHKGKVKGMAQGDGIDLKRSTWENPEGFQPQVRPAVPPPESDPVCGAQGPSGWTCDLKPHPGLDMHWADTGESPGERWIQNWVDVRNFGDGDHVTKVIPGRVERVDRPSDLERAIPTIHEIQTLAEQALASERSADWAIGLDKIRELCSGY